MLERIEELPRMAGIHQVWGASCPQNEMHRIRLCLIIPREKISDPVENFRNDLVTGT